MDFTSAQLEFTSGSHTLEGHLAIPERTPVGPTPALVICHGFPTAAIGARRAGQSYHTLADRIAASKGLPTLAMHYRGCGESEGNFSLEGWLDDVSAATKVMQERVGISSVALIGFGTGAALAICAAARNPAVTAVAAVAPPADFSDWSKDPERLLAHARRVGAIRDEHFPEDPAAWAAELGDVSASASAAEISDRPLFVLHGREDSIVPVFDSRIVADAHGTAELRVVSGAGHLLRYDPRAIAVLLGWVDRLY